jgi:DNA-binding transcriptional MocR family regulator
MVAAIKKHLPLDVQFEIPQGGLFIWLRLPDNLSSKDLLPLALMEGVDFVPGDRFFPGSSLGRSRMRINFVVQPPDEIEEGIKRLSRAIEELSKSK